MKQSILCSVSILLLALCSNASVPDRWLVRQEIILHKISKSEDANSLFFEKDITHRRLKRQAVFPSDDEDISGDGGSGNLEDVFATVSSSEVSSATTTTSSIVWAWYRTNINFLNSVEYTEDLLDYHTDAFKELADEVMVVVEDYLKTQLDGYLEATPLMFSMKDDDVMVLIDVGMCTTSSLFDVRRALLSLVSTGMIGRFRVSEDDFEFRRIGIDSQRRECKAGPSIPPSSIASTTTTSTTAKPVEEEDGSASRTTPTFSSGECGLDEVACTNLECILRIYLCDGFQDCSDGSDETDCFEAIPPSSIASTTTTSTTVKSMEEEDGSASFTTTTVSPRVCGIDEVTCANLECLPRIYVCDGVLDCADGSDEPRDCTKETEVSSGEVEEQKCDPTEFLCIGTGICAQKIWRCDGDNDCKNNFDELNCPPSPPGSRCSATQFECRNQVCISKSYRCDGESDCDDNSDEIGCSSPVIITPPQRYINASEGSTVTINCEAVGVPDPIISWRLNWGNVPPPPRVTMTSRNGIGILTIRKVTGSDQGAYSCEALNSGGSILATPDAILIVDGNTNKPTAAPKPGCPPGEFNTSPNVSTVCKPCYCFGVTDQCTSSRLKYKKIGIEFTDPFNTEGVTLEPTDAIEGDPDVSKPITDNQIRVNPPARELQLIDLSKRFLAAAHYWSLPAQFIGAKINSYGGTLTYSFSYNNSFHMGSTPTQHPDVILEGKEKTLLYRTRGAHPGPITKHQVEALLDETDNWETVNNEPATREDMLDVLSNLDRMLIRTVYDKSMLSTGIGDVSLLYAGSPNTSSSSPTEDTGIIAYTVEECDCPEGYEGLSCQECALGYERITSGPLIGRCVSDAQGDSPTGICDPGYTGPGCTECAPGYVWVAGLCKLNRGHECNVAGTKNVDLDRECECKDTVQGQYCDQCKPGYYYLSERNQDGCLACLCMGVTKNCASSNWNFTKIATSATGASILSITNLIVSPIFNNVVEYEPPQPGTNARVATAQLSGLPNDIYFWLLPENFTGNKMTSYGGYLDYVINYSVGSNAIAITRVADVKIVGDEATLVHFSNEPSHPNRDIKHAVALKEGYWRNDSGQMASRKQLLLVLSNVKYFLIRASYASNMDLIKIKNIRLDEAVPRHTGGSPALAMEHCICPPGYTGFSCEECSDGFFRVLGGSFLGTCQPCNCNGHSKACDKDTGSCLNCQHNTMGDHCEICEVGYYGNAMTGQANACLMCPCPSLTGRTDQLVVGTCTMDIDEEPVCDRCPEGYTGNKCESCATGYERDSFDPTRCQRSRDPGSSCHCDPAGSIDGRCDATEQCRCKPSTMGKKCDQCKPGFFYMSVENPEGGCLPCFCMGVTNQCSSSNHKRNEVTPDFSNNFGDFVLTQKANQNEIREGLEVIDNGRTLSFPRHDLLPRTGGSYYWKLPEEFCGDKIVSYGGRLQYKIEFTTYGLGTTIADADVILSGNDVTLTSNMPRDDSFILTSINLDKSITFKENHWLKPDGRPATREDLLLVLADLDSVLIRASYVTTMLRTSISDVVMETASENMMMSEPLYEVEQCECPDGYKGTSCENCAPGFTRTDGGIYLGLCHLCQCNNHADLCDVKTGACFNCRDNTAGPHCNECAPGYYGNPTVGLSTDCRPCACPGIGSNSFSATCRLDSSDNSLVCTACEEGYSGRQCEVCSPGYEGDPTSPGGRCTRIRNLLTVRVSPKTVSAREDSRVTLRCDVSSPSPVTVNWRRAGSIPRPLPREAVVSDRGRTLVLPSITRLLAGAYECFFASRFERKSDTGVISIQSATPMIKVRVEEPREIRVREGSQITFVCTATSKMPAYLVTWKKEGGKLPMSRVTDFEGILHISNVQLSDSGTYICTGSNMYSIDRETANLLVVKGDDASMPRVEISPEDQSVFVGSDAMFYCTATGYPTPTVQWIRDDGRPMTEDAHVEGNMLMIPSVTMKDQSSYRCRASNSHGFVEATAALDITARGEPPYVTVVTPDVQLTEGESKDLKCTATGAPKPRFTWTKSSGDLDKNEEQLGDVLSITYASLANQGIYTCTATNYYGQHYGRIRVEVKKKDEGKPVCRTDPKDVTAYIGTNSTITCVVGGNPAPEVTWEMENGFPMDENIKVIDHKIYIVGVVSSNAGKYVCVATNAKGESRSKMILRVLKKDLPTVSISPGRFLKVKAGENASFTCTAPEQDDVDITWLRADKKLFSGETFLSEGNRKLNFLRISTNEAGGYMCLAGNVVGYKQVSVNISVMQPPIVSVMPSRYINITEGDSLTLRCDVIGLPLPSVVWLNDTARGLPTMLTNYRLRSNSYTFRNIRSWHAGQYLCRAINEAGTSHQVVRIQVAHKILVPPTVNVTPSLFRGTIGSYVEIECNASGTPEPVISWSKVDGDLPQGSGSEIKRNFLRIPNLTNESVGLYQCKAISILGISRKTARIELIIPPVVKIEPSNEIYLVPGESINVSCTAIAGSQPISLAWKRKLEVNAVSPFLKIVAFDLQQDSGPYSCTAANDAGSTSVTLLLKTLEPPSIELSSNYSAKQVGQSVTFTCKGHSNSELPDLKVTWQKKDQIISDTTRIEISEGVLQVNDISLEDSGYYKCVASNRAGSTEAFAFLEVQVPPSVEMVLEQNSTVLKEGDSLIILCNASGIPQPTVTLRKDNMLMTINSNGAYLIENVDLSHAGEFVCSAVSDAGEAEASTLVQVFKTPTVSISPVENQVRSGDTLELNCTAGGIPQPNILWTRQDGLLPAGAISTNGQLEISNILVEDAGIYNCIASNPAGTGTASTHVDINAYLPYFTQTPLSYMTVHIQDGQFYAGFNITVSFRSITLNGLLLYSYSTNSDFMSLSLADGVVEFRFDVGSGPVTIRSQSSIELDQWHTVKVSRIHRSGQLQLDSHSFVTGKSPGEFRGLELSSDLYVGGIPNSVTLPVSLQSLGSDSGFYGCISQLEFGHGLFDFGGSRDITERIGIVRCKTCSSDGENYPCLNSAICLETHQNKTGYTCQCGDGYVGKNCQFNLEQLCTPDSCSGQGVCQIDFETELGYTCSCNNHYTGPKCSVPITTTTPAPVRTLPRLLGPFARGKMLVRPLTTNFNFPTSANLFDLQEVDENNGNTSLLGSSEEIDSEALFFGQNSYAMTTELQASELKRTNILLRVRRRTHADGLILYVGASTRRSPFLSLTIRNNALEYRFNTGTDTAILRAPVSAVGVGSWHTIRILRKKSRGRLDVDGKTVARARSSGPEDMFLQGPLFIGGVKFWEFISEKLGIREGFSGCVETLRISEVDYSINELFIKKNVKTCSFGISSSPVGTVGSTMTEPTKPRYSARFTGTSYTSFLKNSFRHDQPAEQISIQFQTTEPYGLILFHGEDLISGLKAVSRSRHRRRHRRRRARKKDYITLGVQGSYLVYTFDLGGGMGKATSTFPVSDGALHTATIVRRGSLALMWMDNMTIPVATQSPRSHTMANTPGRLYIGGTPDVLFATAGRYTASFNGCIKNVRLTPVTNSRSVELGASFLNDTNTTPLDFSRSGALERINLRNCRTLN